LDTLIIFDCDGVLVDSEPIANQVLADHLSEHGYPMTQQESLDRFVGGSVPLIVQAVRDEGIGLPDDFVETLRVRESAAFERDLKAIPGILETLTILADHPKCVASSGPMSKIKGNLKRTGLFDHLTSHLFSATMVDHPKPAPDLFLLAAQTMCAPPDSCLVIEDSPKGVEAALRAGMRVLGFTGGGHVSASHVEKLKMAGAKTLFDDMRHLPGLIAGSSRL